VNITEQDVLAALQGAFDRTAPGAGERAVTVEELAAATGHSAPRVRADVRRLLESGQAECVPVYRPYIDGRRGRKPGYRLKAGAA